MQVGIVAQRGNPRAATLADGLRNALRDREVTVWVDEATGGALSAPDAARPMDAFDEADLVVAVGGDGTFLFAGRHAGGTPILGVNLGEVGFLNAVSPDDAEHAVLREVAAYRGAGMAVREVPRIAARVEREGWTSDPAANEIVVQGPRRGHGGGIDYEVRVDGSLYSGGHADGVLIATPTGSSAYNLSERGPLVHPSVDALVVNEMCAAEGMPPLAVDADSTVTVTLTGADATGVVVSDGRRPKELDAPVAVTVERTDPPMRVAGPSADFFEALGKLS